MKNKPVEKPQSRLKEYLLLAMILLAALSLRLAGIWRAEPIDYHPDEWVIAEPVLKITNGTEFFFKTHYKWPACGAIYAVGYSLLALKPIFGEYSYNEILILLRAISAVTGTFLVLAVYLLVKKLFSARAALFSASLIAAAKLGVSLDHEGAVRSITALTVVLAVLLSYDLFETWQNKKRIGKCILLGFIWGFGVSIRWDILLAAIPIAVSVMISWYYSIKAGKFVQTVKINILQFAVIIVTAAGGFLIGIPDFAKSPKQVIMGFTYEMQHSKTGHYGSITRGEGAFAAKVSRTVKTFSDAGGIYWIVPLFAGVLFSFIKINRSKVYILIVMLLWLIILIRNIMAPERHHYVPVLMAVILTAVMLSEISDSPKFILKTISWFVFIIMAASGLIYSLIVISPCWKPDARLLCSRWIKENVPAGSGVTWAPRTHKWMAPGVVIEPDLFAKFPQRPIAGREQYIIAAKSVMDIFKKHPPGEKINPDDWFPSQPPSLEELVLYYEMNQGGGRNIQKVKEFFQKPSFLGMDLSLFAQDPNQDTTCANWAVTLFKIAEKK